MFDNILFDLDGTLTDSGPGIMNAAVYALEHYGLSDTRENLRRFVGPPLHKSFEDFYGFSEEKALEAVRVFREYYLDKGVWENSPYEGIRELLEELKARGKKLIVATSKPEKTSVEVLTRFELIQYFDVVAGDTWDNKRTDKAEVIKYALEQAGVSDKSTCLMVGDRMYDIKGANTAGLQSCGVLWGYGSREELLNEGATYIAEQPEDVLKLV